MNAFTTVRILVVGDDNVGKTTLVRALCGPLVQSRSPDATGCAVSLRVVEETRTVEEFYDISGSAAFVHGRRVFLARHRFDGVLFVHDATAPPSRASLATVWVPEVMQYLGDVGAITTGGRLDGHGVNVRASAVLSELRFLWRQSRSAHAAVSLREAAGEAVHLCARLIRLLLNETGLWPDPMLDLRAEAAFLATSLVPVAVVAMKTDLLDCDDADYGNGPGANNGHGFGASASSSAYSPPSTAKEYPHSEPFAGSAADRPPRPVPHLQLHVHSAPSDPRLRAFLRRAAEAARRRTVTVKTGASSRNAPPHLMLGFV